MLDRILGNYDAIERDIENDYAVFEEVAKCHTDVDIQLVNAVETADDDDEKQSNILRLNLCIQWGCLGISLLLNNPIMSLQ